MLRCHGWKELSVFPGLATRCLTHRSKPHSNNSNSFEFPRKGSRWSFNVVKMHQKAFRTYLIKLSIQIRGRGPQKNLFIFPKFLKDSKTVRPIVGGFWRALKQATRILVRACGTSSIRSQSSYKCLGNGAVTVLFCGVTSCDVTVASISNVR